MEFEIRYQNMRSGDIDYKTVVAETYEEAANNFKFTNPECLIDEIERSDYFPYTQKFFFGQDYASRTPI